MSTSRGLSDSQANAEALSRRETTYTLASEASVKAAWDFHHREPKDLNDATRRIRKAYSDDVPMRLHEGYDSIGEGGTPKMDARAEGYIMGHDQAGETRPDPETGERPALDWYRTPYRATVAHWRGSRCDARCAYHSVPVADIIDLIAISGQGAVQATISVGVSPWCAPIVAWNVTKRFLRSLSDVKVDIAKRAPEAA